MQLYNLENIKFYNFSSLGILINRSADPIFTYFVVPVVFEWLACNPYPFVNTLRPRQNGRHFADDMFKCIFLNENVWIPIEI